MGVAGAGPGGRGGPGRCSDLRTGHAVILIRLTVQYQRLILHKNSVEHIPDSREERADLQVVVGATGFDPGSGFTAHHLFDDPYVAVLPAGHRFADREEVDLADLADERWVDNDFARGWCRANLIEACTAAGFSPTFQVEAHDYPTALAFVGAGIGLTVLPALGAAKLPDGVTRVRLVRPTPIRSIYVVVHDAVEHTPAVQTAVAALREAAGAADAR
ncbi:LysR substrate-binding domain-containing protein [Micromonospora sp. NPDC051296]|uniref:LysR substrate-binding domain-containing protein n=1 Tax=Micromonospora sp. NPDC051296 TaxID=3155046 RepID=UPI00342A2243